VSTGIGVFPGQGCKGAMSYILCILAPFPKCQSRNVTMLAHFPAPVMMKSQKMHQHGSLYMLSIAYGKKVYHHGLLFPMIQNLYKKRTCYGKVNSQNSNTMPESFAPLPPQKLTLNTALAADRDNADRESSQPRMRTFPPMFPCVAFSEIGWHHNTCRAI